MFASISKQIGSLTQNALKELYDFNIAQEAILISETKPEFIGDYTIVLFSLLKSVKEPAEVLGKKLGDFLVNKFPEFISNYNLIKGFLNVTIKENLWLKFLGQNFDNENFGLRQKIGKKVMIEYSSPNTNKPLHLGHLRNNFLGWSVAEIYKTCGYEVVKTCIANDRGIHICKSMIAWQLFANGSTPESTGIKGDHFVGDYYVMFNDSLKREVAQLVSAGINKDDAEKQAPLMLAAQSMLVDWEHGKPDVINLWKTMNDWVYKGFAETYKRIGTDFDKIYYESDTYILGKDLVEEGLKKNVFFSKADESVWIDLTAEGLDEKIVRRKDGTAVYMTQDIGLAKQKYEQFKTDLSIYVVGDEQNYHFKVLKLICQKLKIPAADHIFHLSYGMVELPTGKMKTREGSVVDADDLLDEMFREAENKTKEQGKTDGFSIDELNALYETIGTGGLKFFLLRVDPKKKLLFNPRESIDLHGFTATFIQYAYARISSILRKEAMTELNVQPTGLPDELLPLEKNLVMLLEKYPNLLDQACQEMNPSVIAGYVYQVAKTFNSFYAAHSVSNAESEQKKILRLRLCKLTAIIIRNAMSILGIRVPERM
jgi:arginyl-tRNA synthetase